MRKAFERIRLHVGPPKSGATSIQHFLVNNRSTLEKRGIYVPSVMRRGAQHIDLPLLFRPASRGAGTTGESARPKLSTFE